ncbi:MAG: hypothetical protein HQK98_10230 [Nitrospirae bacterium]|nr:hypothetical protein [Nitrospirota bacterium]
MKRIIVIDDQWAMDSPLLRYALKASKSADTEIIGIMPVAASEMTQLNKTRLDSAAEQLARDGVRFSSYVVGTEPEEFIGKMKGLMPASLVLVGDIVFDGLIRNGIILKKELSAPVTTARALDSTPERAKKGINMGVFMAYTIGSLIMYGVLFPKIVTLNEKLFMSMTVTGAVTTLVVVVVHAWVWGNTVHILPKLFRLEK